MAGGWEDPFPRWTLHLISGVLGTPWPHPTHVLGFSEDVDLRLVALFNGGHRASPDLRCWGHRLLSLHLMMGE